MELRPEKISVGSTFPVGWRLCHLRRFQSFWPFPLAWSSFVLIGHIASIRRYVPNVPVGISDDRNCFKHSSRLDSSTDCGTNRKSTLKEE